MFCADHLVRPMTHRKEVIQGLVRAIRASKIEFDSIGFCGLSGAIVAPCVADKLKKPFFAVRKGENRHSIFNVECVAPRWTIKRYVIIDDFIASGETVSRIIRESKLAFRPCKCVGIALYGVSGMELFGEIPIIHSYSIAGKLISRKTP